MKSVLDVEVSCFLSYMAKEPVSVNLREWLVSDMHAERILELRNISDKQKRDKIKATLPAVTVSGLFYPHRKAKNLRQHSGLICIDIDYKDNKHISNYCRLKEQLFHIEHIAYAGLSASGKGFFLIIPILYPECHSWHYNAIEKDFTQFGITIDKAPKSVVSLRGCSYDTSHLFRNKPIIYSNMLLKEKKWIGKRIGLGQSLNPHPHPYPNTATTKDRVEITINKICQSRIDITGQEPDWFTIACAFANEFGAYGRDYFQVISQFHPKYNPAETDKKYSYALKGNYSRIGIGSFFRIAHRYF